MIKILYIVSTLLNSGPINVLYNLINHIDRNVFDVQIMTLSPEEENSDWERFKNIDVHVEQMNLSRVQGIFAGKRRIIKYIRHYKPEIIHSHGLRPDMIAASLSENVITMCTIHNYAYQDYVMKYGFVKGSLMAHKHIDCLKRINYPIACSYTIRSLLDKHQVYTRAIQNGIDVRQYSMVSADYKSVIRQRIGIPQETTVFISVGSLIERKNPVAVVKAFCSSSMCNKAHLIMVGTGPLIDKLRKESGNLSNVIFTGHVNNVIDYLHASDYFISASRSEGLPMTVLEAMSCGLPVILSNIQQHKEILEHDINAGLTFDSSIELTQMINNICNNDYDLMSNTAMNVIKNYLSAEVMARYYQTIYTSIISG